MLSSTKEPREGWLSTTVKIIFSRYWSSWQIAKSFWPPSNNGINISLIWSLIKEITRDGREEQPKTFSISALSFVLQQKSARIQMAKQLFLEAGCWLVFSITVWSLINSRSSFWSEEGGTERRTWQSFNACQTSSYIIRNKSEFHFARYQTQTLCKTLRALYWMENETSGSSTMENSPRIRAELSEFSHNPLLNKKCKHLNDVSFTCEVLSRLRNKRRKSTWIQMT